MKKTLIVLSLLFSIVFFASAQEGSMMPRFSVGGSVGGAVGSQSNYFPIASGLVLKGEMPLGEAPVSLVVSTGFTMYTTADGYSTGYSTYGGSYSYGSIAIFLPVQLGIRAYVDKLFFEGDAGASFNLNGNSSNYTANPTALVLTPAVGYGFRFDRAKKYGLDVSLFYDTRLESAKAGYGSFSQIGVKAAFSIGWAK